MGRVVFCDDDEATGYFVEAMHDPGTQIAIDAGESGEAVQQRVDQCSSIALILGGTGASVDHHSSRLVDDGEIVVLVDDIEWDVFSKGAHFWTMDFAENFDVLIANKTERRL